jgi:hypothetical protein
MMVRRIILSLILLFVILATALPTLAENDSSWIVHSEYQSPVPGREKSTIWWIFKASESELGERQVFVKDYNARVQCRAELYYDQNNNLVQVDCYRQGREEEVCDAVNYDAVSPAIVNQSLVPGDWLNRELPFAPQNKACEYLVKEKIGVTIFSSHIKVVDEVVTLAEARALGMIKADNENLVQGQQLYLVSVKKVEGLELVPVMQQLWAAGDRFWLYEEKDGRRSWRCQQKILE